MGNCESAKRPTSTDRERGGRRWRTKSQNVLAVSDTALCKNNTGEVRRLNASSLSLAPWL